MLYITVNLGGYHGYIKIMIPVDVFGLLEVKDMDEAFNIIDGSEPGCTSNSESLGDVNRSGNGWEMYDVETVGELMLDDVG